MVVTRKKKAGSSSTTLEENEAVENALASTKNSDSVTVMEESNVDAQVKNKEELTSEKERNREHEKINSEEGNRKHKGNNSEQEGRELMEVDNDENAITTKMNGDDTTADQNISEDDEIDGQEDVMWEDDEEDSEEDDEENVEDEDEFSDEHATEEDNDDGVEISEEEATEEEEEEEEEKEEEEKEEDEKTTAEKGIAKGDGGKAVEHNTEKEEPTTKNIEKSKERSKKKVQAENSKKVEPGDKPESSRKRKTKKRVESMGMIFICSSKTKNDCYQYRVLGLPETKKDVVKKIYTGMRLFLYDVDLKLMYGIYKAAGPGGYNIEPKAFKSQFPSQVRFKVLDDCLPLPEEKFKKVIKENYYTNTKFDCILTSEQVKKLCALFISSSKRQKHNKLGRNRIAEKLHPVRRERSRRPRLVDERRLPLREERVYHERPRKRPRKSITPLPPRTLDVNSYRRDPYVDRHSPYRTGRDPLPKRHDPYLDRRSPYRERDPLSSRRDPYPEVRYAYKDDPYVDRRDVYMDMDGRDDPYLEPRRDYRDGRDSYLERRDLLKDERDPYIKSRDLYVERRGLYSDNPRSETYTSYRRDPISDRRDVYREDRGVAYRDSYRREEVLERQPLSLETTRRVNDIGRLDAYVSYRERPSYAETIYSEEYPSRVGLPREYRL